MEVGARTPEELETLFEDACVLHDDEALAQLFHPDGVLIAGGGLPDARGRGEIARAVRTLWAQERTYLAGPQRVLQRGDTALVLSGSAVNVVRRGDGRTWHYLICCLDLARG